MLSCGQHSRRARQLVAGHAHAEFSCLGVSTQWHLPPVCESSCMVLYHPLPADMNIYYPGYAWGKMMLYQEPYILSMCPFWRVFLRCSILLQVQDGSQSRATTGQRHHIQFARSISVCQHTKPTSWEGLASPVLRLGRYGANNNTDAMLTPLGTTLYVTSVCLFAGCGAHSQLPRLHRSKRKFLMATRSLGQCSASGNEVAQVPDLSTKHCMYWWIQEMCSKLVSLGWHCAGLPKVQKRIDRKN